MLLITTPVARGRAPEPPSNFAPTAIAFSPSSPSVLDNAVDGDVIATGTITDTDDTGMSSVTCSNSKLKIVYTSGLTFSLQRSGTGTLTAGVAETTNVTVTDAHGNPYTTPSPLSVDVADHTAETLISVVTVTNGVASSKTNEPVEFGFPMLGTDLASGKFLKVYDDDGSGNQGTVLANYQADNHASDLQSAVRFAKVSAVVPALASSATRKLRVYSVTGTAPANTAITASDILATSYDVQAQFNIGGTTFTASARTALGGGTSWSTSTGKADAVTHGAWRSNGACTEIICSMPPRSGGGGTEHASGDGIRVWFHIAAWKVGTGAVGGGNAITYIKTTVVLENGALERASPANYWYGLTIARATSLSNSTLISTDDTDADGNTLRYAYPRSQPAATVTLGSQTLGATTTATLNTTTWANDIVGAHIHNAGGAGKAYVISRTSGTVVQIYIYEAFSAGSYTSGNWQLEGIGHLYGTRWPLVAHVGTKPTNIPLLGNETSAKTPTGNALRDRLRATFMFPNHQTAIGGVTHNMTDLNLMRSDGQIRPFTFSGPEGALMGDVLTDMGRSGARGDIGYLTLWEVDGVTKYDTNGRRKIFENNLWLCLQFYHFLKPYTSTLSDGGRGVTISPASGLSYKINGAHSQTNPINTPALSWQNCDSDLAHMPSQGYIPYLLTGDYFWLDELQTKAVRGSWFSNDTYAGTGINKTMMGDATNVNSSPFGEGQTRADAWATRDVGHACVCTPDAARSLLFIPKSTFNTWMAKHWDASRYGPLNTGGSSSFRWSTNGPRNTKSGGSDTNFGHAKAIFPYMTYYLIWTVGCLRELGLHDSDAAAFETWLAEHVEGILTAGTVPPDWLIDAYNTPQCDYAGAAMNLTWLNTYKKASSAALHGGLGGNNVSYTGRRQANSSGNVTLSTITPGAGVIMTLPVARLGGGGTSFYADGANGGWVELHSGTNPGEAGDIIAWGRITAVDASHASNRQLTIDTTGSPSWGATSVAAANVSLPSPALADAGAQGTLTIGGEGLDYNQQYAICANLLIDFGRGSPATAAKTYVTTRSGWVASSGDKNHYNVINR